jgi:hypothetical protein
MSSDKVPAEAFESLLPKVINILQLSQNPEGVASLEARKALLQAVSYRDSYAYGLSHASFVFKTTDLKESLGRAQELANSLPGGEVTVEEQDAVIAMLEEMQSDRR